MQVGFHKFLKQINFIILNAVSLGYYKKIQLSIVSNVVCVFITKIAFAHETLLNKNFNQKNQAISYLKETCK